MWSARSWLTVMVAVALFAAACASGEGDSVSSPDGTPSAPSTQPEPPAGDPPSGEPELPEPPADDAPSGEPELPERPAGDAPSAGADGSVLAGEMFAPEPDPAGLEVLRREVVGSRGGVVAGGGVEVRVPPGAVGEPVDVEIRAPLGAFGDEVGGAVVGIDHVGALAAPVVVSWDVSALSDEQRQMVLVVRWDEDVEGWLTGDVDYEIVDGVLTANIAEWSWWTWITDNLGSFSQTIQEVFGRRVDALKCSGEELPGWVSASSEPEDGATDAAIRICYDYEPRGGEAVTMRMVNNRTFSQFVSVNPPDGWDDDVEGPAAAVSLVGALHLAASLAFTDSDRVFMPPLTGATVSVPRPQDGISGVVKFNREHTYWTFLADVVFFVAAHIPAPTVPGNWAYVTEFLTRVFECTEENTEENAAINWEVLKAIADTVVSCVADLLNPTNAEHTEFLEALAQTGISESQIDKSFGPEADRGVNRAAKVLAIAEFAGILIDLAADEFFGSESWQMTMRGSVATLGDWDPTCTDVAVDSNRLHEHLLNREPFRQGDRAIEHNLHEFPEWEWSATRAVTPLEACGDGHNVAVADDVITTWLGGDEPVAFGFVRDLILAMVAPDPTGGYTAVTAGGNHSCALHGDGAVACWGDNNFDQLHEPAGTYTAITAGGAHTCGLRADGAVRLLGPQQRQPDRRARRGVRRGVHRHLRRLRTLVRAAHKPNHHLLGREHPRPSKRSHRPIHRHRRRRRPRLRTKHKPNHHLLGQQHLPPNRRTRRRVHHHHRSLRAHLRTTHKPNHHLLGRQQLRPNSRARGHLHRPIRRREPHLRTTHKPNHHLLGQHQRHPTRRSVHRHRSRPRPHLRTTHQPNHHLLGQQRARTNKHTHPTTTTPRRHTGTADRRRPPACVLVCAPTTPSPAGATTTSGRRMSPTAHTPPYLPAKTTPAHYAQTKPSPAGAQTAETILTPPTTSGRPTRRRAPTSPSPPAGSTRAGSAPTTPSPAGATTARARPTRRRAPSPPSPPAGSTRAGYVPTTPSPAGAPTRTGRPTRPADTFAAVTRRRSLPHVWVAHRQHHHLLGQQLPWADRRAGGHLYCRHYRRALHVRATYRQHHHLLGRQPREPGLHAGGHLCRRRHRLVARVWVAHRQHHHLLGRQLPWGGGRAGGHLHRRGRRLPVFVWIAQRRHRHLLGPRRWRAVGDADGIYSAVSAGGGRSCELRSDGTITCWGYFALDLRSGGGE